MDIKEHMLFRVIRYNRPEPGGDIGVHMDTIDGRVLPNVEERETILRMLGWCYIDAYLEKYVGWLDEMLEKG